MQNRVAIAINVDGKEYSDEGSLSNAESIFRQLLDKAKNDASPKDMTFGELQKKLDSLLQSLSLDDDFHLRAVSKSDGRIVRFIESPYSVSSANSIVDAIIVHKHTNQEECFIDIISEYVVWDSCDWEWETVLNIPNGPTVRVRKLIPPK